MGKKSIIHALEDERSHQWIMDNLEPNFTFYIIQIYRRVILIRYIPELLKKLRKIDIHGFLKFHQSLVDNVQVEVHFLKKHGKQYPKYLTTLMMIFYMHFLLESRWNGQAIALLDI